MVNDIDNPESITIMSEERLTDLAEEEGLDVDYFDGYEFGDEEYEFEEDGSQVIDLLGWNGDDDDDEGGGLMQ